MRAIAIAAAFAAIAAAAQQRPNEVIYKSEDWNVVRSVRDAGNVVACTGFYRHNPRVQLSRDTFIVKLPKEAHVRSVALGFGRGELRPPRPLTSAEQSLGAVVLEGADFEQMVKSRMLFVLMEHGDGKKPLRFDLRTIEPALAAIRDCKPG
ncbi:hypothetical protein [Ramlibacter albus]|uniref:Uncharacterized protein n=1 Tax=Ramlibacter albus TaxID=2079448 RepID=A0A923M9E9_9BURK|nr:hypothetical protein [Ramlibacter albus]MBC5764927.1 hypothetical protein [Ramlibacter albus]